VNVDTIAPAQFEVAGAILYQAFERSASARDRRAPWPNEEDAAAFARRTAEAEPGWVVIAESGGAPVGVGAARRRGEVVSIGPIAAYVDGRGIGSAILDELLRRADDDGAASVRLYADAWNEAAYALYASRGFSTVDVVAHVDRHAERAAPPGSARGLEVKPPQRGDDRELDALTRLDSRLTGHERRGDLAASVRLVARRRGEIVGYLGGRADAFGIALGPAVAVDISDLFTMVSHALAGTGDEPWIPAGQPVRARLSTAAPAAPLAALGLGFRVRELGVVLSRGAPPPTRPPQLYSIDPEVL
jgi:ribosomal protein S18 acetylase RimI-like enzyme